MSAPNVRISGPPKLPSGAPPAPAPSAPPSSPPAARPALKVPLSWQDWLMRLLLVAVIAASAAVVYWSYQRLAKLQERSRRLEDAITRLNNEIAIMEGKYTQADIDKLMARSREAEALLFAGQDALYNWFTELKLQLVPLSLNAVADFGQAVTNRAGRHSLTLVPATVSIDIGPAPQVESRRSAYDRMMLLMQALAQQPKRVDVVGLTADGGTNSIRGARVVLELWAGEETKQETKQ